MATYALYGWPGFVTPPALTRPADAYYQPRPRRGTGILSSDFPGALTTIEGAPVSAQVLVRRRSDPPGLYGDGALVAITTSSASGEWVVEGLDSGLRYDVSARYAGENDALQANVRPFDEPRFSAAVQVPVGVPLDAALPIIGGTGSVSVTYVSGSYPSGVSLVGDRLQGAWPTGATGSYPITFDLTDDEGTFTRVLNIELYLPPMSLSPSALPGLAIGTPVSVPFSATGGEGPYTFAVTAGSLPAGLSLNGSTGEISGTPTTLGAYSFEITTTDVRSATVSKTFAGSVLAKHSYWRLNITAHNGNANTSIVELRMRGSSGINVATGGTAFTNTEYSSGYVVGYAFDGNAGTRWAANGTHPLPHQIGYIMAAPEDVDAVEIVSSTNTNAPRDFTVQSSDDGVTWTDEWSVSGQTGWAANEQRTFSRP